MDRKIISRDPVWIAENKQGLVDWIEYVLVLPGQEGTKKQCHYAGPAFARYYTYPIHSQTVTIMQVFASSSTSSWAIDARNYSVEKILLGNTPIWGLDDALAYFEGVCQAAVEWGVRELPEVDQAINQWFMNYTVSKTDESVEAPVVARTPEGIRSLPRLGVHLQTGRVYGDVNGSWISPDGHRLQEWETSGPNFAVISITPPQG